MKIGILTSTRADFGIYRPFLKELTNDNFFKVELIVFGTHLSEKHGYTINEITEAGYKVSHKLDTIPQGDKPVDISKSMAKTIAVFSEFWGNNKFDLVFALGDRYEMFAAVTAASPFNQKFVHLHAGETTLGAVDNMYRHAISLMSDYLFVSTEEYKTRAAQIKSDDKNIFKVGALSIDNLKKETLFSKEEFEKIFHIDLNKLTILSTFHPETISLSKNKLYTKELLSSFDILRSKYQIVITMPNADTLGLMIRTEIEKFAENKSNIIMVESFGMKGYLSCMKHCSFLLGNTSSGFVEATFFPKWVINLGDRQKGRIITPNIISIEPDTNKILEAVKQIENKSLPDNCNIYGDGNTAIKIKNIIKNFKN